MKKPEISTISRRRFLVGSAASVAAGAVVGATAVGIASAADPLPPLPWPYATLDVEAIRRKAWIFATGG